MTPENKAGPPPKPAPPRLLAPTHGRDTADRERLAAFLKIFHGDDRVLIVINADPDAIASAAAVKRMLWRHVAQVVVTSVSQMKRADNLRLLEFLKLVLEPWSPALPSGFSKLVMVDSQPAHSPQTQDLPFNVVIDHHPPTALAAEAPHPDHVDIRPEVGANTSILTGYLKAARIKPNPRLATAMFLAIKTDTQNFVRQGQALDMRAFRWLHPFISADSLAEIEKGSLARSSFKHFLAGLEAAVFRRNTAHTFLSKVDHSDTLVIVADFLMKISGVSRSVAAGLCDQKLVVIFRAGGLRQDMGRLAQAAFKGLGSAGGHKNMARAEIPLANLEPKLLAQPAALGRFILRRLALAGGKGQGGREGAPPDSAGKRGAAPPDG
ncbi:MAG: DHH family phosphoesterase [Candidatus Adiutrix sp.]|jgi:nanoRNase/pAp phosphatase (c-di-AMP/oligoRNAs hydrolase)|nr:DHH family phosphoesterase [Candidatus Adiutrix sp.]